MKIQRINSYDDPRFRKEILQEHGAFLVDDCKPCEFKITGRRSAVMSWQETYGVDELIEKFRFYSQHITEIYSTDGTLLRSFEGGPIFELDLDQIQPSQFYVDQEKLNAVTSFIHQGSDIIIPVIREPETNRYIACDGHTRLYAAWKKGYSTICAYDTDVNKDLFAFVKEAKDRKIVHINEMKLVSHEEYEKCWNQFCTRYFAQKAEIHYKELKIGDLYPEMLTEFHRYQIEKNVWVETDSGDYVLIERPKVKDWDEQYKRDKIQKWRALLEGGGRLFGAYDEDQLIGFSAIGYELLGKNQQYIELTQLHVSNEYRGRHIGKTLFDTAVQAARAKGAKKLYIEASAAEESQLAYKYYGAVYAVERVKGPEEDRDLVRMEYIL